MRTSLIKTTNYLLREHAVNSNKKTNMCYFSAFEFGFTLGCYRVNCWCALTRKRLFVSQPSKTPWSLIISVDWISASGVESCLTSTKPEDLRQNLGFLQRRGVFLAPAARRVADAWQKQRCLNIFARTCNPSSIIKRPCFNLGLIS